MIGRYTNLQGYRELLQLKEFYPVAGGGALILASWAAGGRGHGLAADLLALGAALLLGGPIILGAARGLKEKGLNVDELVSLAIIASVAIGEYLAAAVVALIMVTGSLLEEFTARKARSAIDTLAQVAPEQAILLQGEKEVTVPVEKIRPGDLVIVPSGGKVPVDGRVIKGGASLDQASLTGESLPVEKGPGEKVYAGSIVYSGRLIVEAKEVGEGTTLGRLIQLVQEAEGQRAPILRTADHFARYFTPVILGLSLLVFLFSGDLHRSITVLIVGCPCAFILASPTAIVSALGNASRNGILVKGGALLEEAARIDTVLFDKTGTLTTGRPVVTEIIPLGGASPGHVLYLAASAEKYSRHPLARAILGAAREKNVTPGEPEGCRDLPGRGIQALVGGREVFVGQAPGPGSPRVKGGAAGAGDPAGDSPREALGCGCCRRNRKTPREVTQGKQKKAPPGNREATAGNMIPETGEKELTPVVTGPGHKALLVKEGQRAAGYIVIRDSIRPGVKSLLGSLGELGVTKVEMLTGDHPGPAAITAEAGGFQDYRAGLLPGEKLERVQELKRDGHKVAMVGDGVNDAPALAASHLGIAMGTLGTQAAMEAADVALLGEDLSRVHYFLQLGRRTVKTINHNIAFALFFNGAALAASSLGLLNPILGAVTHNLGSVLVVLNSARLIRTRA